MLNNFLILYLQTIFKGTESDVQMTNSLIIKYAAMVYLSYAWQAGLVDSIRY